MPLTVARALAVAAIAFPICHLVMEAKATTRGVSVKKRTWTCMHAVGEALHKRVFWEYPTTYQHKPHHHHQLHDRNQYLSSSSTFGSRVHQEDQGPSPVLSVVRGGWRHAPRAHPDMVDWQPHRGFKEKGPQPAEGQTPTNIEKEPAEAAEGGHEGEAENDRDEEDRGDEGHEGEYEDEHDAAVRSTCEKRLRLPGASSV